MALVDQLLKEQSLHFTGNVWKKKMLSYSHYTASDYQKVCGLVEKKYA